VELRELDATLNEALAGQGAALGQLTGYEADTRYPPGVWVTPEEAGEAVRMAEEIRAIVLSLLDVEP